MSDLPVILITGASAGIGESTARLFGRSGYRTVLAARNLQKLEEAAEKIHAEGGIALPVQADVTSLDDINKLAQITMEKFGRIDILFNNAGIGLLNWLEKLDPRDDIETLLDVNLKAMIWMAQAVLPHMIQQRRGHIINMMSAAALIAPPMYSIYSASKFGMRGFTESLRREVGIYGVNVSGIYPGGVATDFAEQAVKLRKTGIQTPGWMRLEPSDVAEKVFWLAHHPRRMVIMPWFLRLAYGINLFLPGWVDLGTKWIFVQRERI